MLNREHQNERNIMLEPKVIPYELCDTDKDKFLSVGKLKNILKDLPDDMLVTHIQHNSSKFSTIESGAGFVHWLIGGLIYSLGGKGDILILK